MLGFGYQTRLDRILFDVRPNAVELDAGSYQVIVVFLLQKRLSRAAEQFNGPIGGGFFPLRQSSLATT
jgi:hypothetical protein